MTNNNTKITLGSWIVKRRRKELHIKQSELAELMGVTDNQISNIENGKSFPTFKNFIVLCNILQCNADYFLSGILKTSVSENIVDIIASMTIEEQETLWHLLECYIHNKKI